MLKRTALFIYLFKEKNLEKLLEEQFIEQLGIIDTIGEMYLDPENEFQLNYLFEKTCLYFLIIIASPILYLLKKWRTIYLTKLKQ